MTTVNADVSFLFVSKTLWRRSQKLEVTIRSLVLSKLRNLWHIYSSRLQWYGHGLRKDDDSVKNVLLLKLIQPDKEMDHQIKHGKRWTRSTSI